VNFTVAKVGGSLFDMPDLRARLRGWIDTQETQRLLLVAGGGPIVDVVRQMNQVHGLGEERAHWLAIDAMSVAAELLMTMVHGIVVRTAQEAEICWAQGHIAILEPRHYCRNDESMSTLPHSWDVTSDSIAACVALAWGAARLVMLKSTSPPDSLDDWSITGYCDPWFNRVLTGADLTVSAINLRATKT
jgi:aspartokinase-like uncharacterized kinase